MVALQSAYAAPPPRNLSVAVVNHAPYHLEVVAGLLHALKQVPRVQKVVWYQSGQGAGSGMPRAVGETLPAREIVSRSGFDALLGADEMSRVEFRDAWHDKPSSHDFAIFVSPEYFVEGTKAWVDGAKPSAVMMLFHNGDNPSVQRLAPLHPRLHFVALSPHVAGCATAAQHLTPTPGWMMPVRPFGELARVAAAVAKAANDTSGAAVAEQVGAETLKAAKAAGAPAACSWEDEAHLPHCLDGFALQGNFEPQRRNYPRLWQGLQRERAKAAAAAVEEGEKKSGGDKATAQTRVHLLGRGSVQALGLPSDLLTGGHVQPHAALPYPAYYGLIQRTHALLLSLGSDTYLRCKASSSMGASLSTGTPLVADASVLGAYRYLAPKHVYVLGKGEDEAAAMRRVAAMPGEEHAARRKALAELTASLNRAAVQMLHNVIPTAEESPHPAGSAEGEKEWARRVAAARNNGAKAGR
jgi:hypothetical protein